MCQQSAEKYLKALIFKRTKAVPPKTHQCEHLATLLSAPSEVVDAARRVESDYMGSRYPDMAQGVPYEMFTDATSEQATRAAEVVERWVIQQLSMTP
jgi:HEPN domain-containing protein